MDSNFNSFRTLGTSAAPQPRCAIAMEPEDCRSARLEAPGTLRLSVLWECCPNKTPHGRPTESSQQGILADTSLASLFSPVAAIYPPTLLRSRGCLLSRIPTIGLLAQYCLIEVFCIKAVSEHLCVGFLSILVYSPHLVRIFIPCKSRCLSVGLSVSPVHHAPST